MVKSGQKEPPRRFVAAKRPGSTICCGQEWVRKSHQDPAVRFVTAKSVPEKASKTRQYDLLRPSGPEIATKTRQHELLRPWVGQKEPPTPGSTICYGQEWARKSHQDPAVRFVTAKSLPERASKTRQYDLLRPRVGPERATKTRQYFVKAKSGPEKSHQDPAVRFVTAKSGPERATKTRQYDLLRPRVGQKEPPRPGSTICYGQEWARKSHQDQAVRFVTAKNGTEKATKPRQYDLLRPRVGQKEPPRPGSTICYGQDWARKSHQNLAVRFVTAKESGPERATKTGSGPERATKTRQYDLLRPRVGQKEPPRPGSTICYGQEWARKSHQDTAVRFVTAKSGPERATKTRQYDLLRPRVGQKEPPRPGSTICYGQEWARKSHQDPAVRFVTGKSGPERATKTRQYDLLRARVGQKEPARHGSTICYGQEWARKSHQDPAVRFVTKSGQKEPPRPGSTICCGQEWNGPERATKTRQYDLLRPRVGQKELSRPGSTICYGQEWARKSHQDQAVRFVTAKSGPQRATKIRQYDLLRPGVGQKEPPRPGSTICYGQ